MKEQQNGPRRLRFGEVLRILRVREGLTVEELADLVGWHPHRVHALERGTENEPATEAEALEISKALDIDPKLLTVAVPK